MIDWSQDRLAEAAGVGLTTVRDLENARRSDSAVGMGAIARALRNEGVIFLSSDGREVSRPHFDAVAKRTALADQAWSV